MRESEILYDQVKAFFEQKKIAQFVIEMTDQPISEWQIYVINSPDEMIKRHGQILGRNNKAAGFIYYEGQRTFYFADENFYKTEYTETGKLLGYSDFTLKYKLLEKAMEEFKQIIQGS